MRPEDYVGDVDDKATSLTHHFARAYARRAHPRDEAGGSRRGIRCEHHLFGDSLASHVSSIRSVIFAFYLGWLGRHQLDLPMSLADAGCWSVPSSYTALRPSRRPASSARLSPDFR
ncbi:hypothetical protein CSOJ01_07539 [Colletotrichum sojae]|uniref:Uncharacterized protein n=1 Tax=Colletotrichum sojae TaxID=2175907 RepID=A0A8H6MU63_9PEZI|nr:hypothetical protein CSOJ01_07539 [Colletotrichum sojae]